MTEMCGEKDRLSLYFLTLNAGSINLPKLSGPAPIQHSGSWALQGCWAEPSNGVRALPRVFRDGAAMTVERCMSVAAAFQYAGVENGEECWFGNAINSGSSNTGNLSLCRTQCRGSSDSEFCGGLGHLLIYKASSTGLAPSPPTAPSTVAGKPWVGCYEDSNLRTLAGRSTSSANMTLGMCVSFCQQFNYAYFGAEYARECYCGNSIGSAAHKVGPSECDMACVGSDGTQLCGRDSRISLYGTAPKSSQPLIVGGLPWKGCFQNYSPPLLDGPSSQAVGVTLAVCAKTGSIGKYHYFAVEASNTCWCGNKIQDERFTADSSECNMPCDGFSGSFCGGINRLSLYGQ